MAGTQVKVGDCQKSRHYTPEAGWCQLYSAEKLEILKADHKTTLNKRSKVFSDCLHKKIYLLNNYQAKSPQPGLDQGGGRSADAKQIKVTYIEDDPVIIDECELTNDPVSAASTREPRDSEATKEPRGAGYQVNDCETGKREPEDGRDQGKRVASAQENGRAPRTPRKSLV